MPAYWQWKIDCVFQALPYFVYAKAVLSCKEEVTFQNILENCKSKVIVISPLLNLIQDQENTLVEKKIKVTSLMTTSVSSVEQLGEVGSPARFDMRILHSTVIFQND